MSMRVKESDFPCRFETDSKIPIELSFGLEALVSESLFYFLLRNVVHISRGDRRRHMKLIEGIA